MDKPIKVKIISVSENKDENFKLLAFADDKEDPKNYVIIQRSYEFDDQDKKLGMDSYYLEVNDQSNSAYAACEVVIFKENRLKFIFNEKKGFNKKELTLDIKDASFNGKELIQHLKFMFNDILIVE